MESESGLYNLAVTPPARMHLARTPSKYVDKAGNTPHCESILVRRSFRDGTTVRRETAANLSMLSTEVINASEAALKGQPLVPADTLRTMGRSLPHGHVAAVAATARKLGLVKLLERIRELGTALLR